ncbi:MAG: Zn-dependent peptidase ImmA (M78 family) [Oleispira sp.]|jgi:Zn-dependent peptidase ImmA (M78 family)
MHRSLESAKNLADSIKFSHDRDISFARRSKEHAANLKGHFYTSELLISKDVTPNLYQALSNVMKRLSVPEDVVTAFVYASSEINASCFLGLDDECVLRFSSGLIDILNISEFEFVVGHEMGHFLCDHPPIENNVSNRSLEDFIQKRAQEISADRIGLVGCDNLNVAVKALIKTVSGLRDEYLRFDISSFISQLQKSSNHVSPSIESSHPSMLVRCRALLWFSLSQSYIDKKEYVKQELSKLDSIIESDLDRYVNSSAKRIIDKAKETLSFWTAAYEIVQKEKFSKTDQNEFSERFGSNTLKSLLNFLNSLDKSEVDGAVFEQVQQARNELEILIPRGFEEEVANIALKYKK